MSETNQEKIKAARHVVRKYELFGLHLALIAIVASVCLWVINGQTFNTLARRPRYYESDGSPSHAKSYAALQSDVATAVSLAATATRVVGGWWSAGCIWRCVFFAMERGGISLAGLSRVVSKLPASPRHFNRRSSMIIIYITLFTTFAIDYFSSFLNGAFTWEPASKLVPGRVPVTGIQQVVNYANISDLFSITQVRQDIVEIGSASASLAWLANLQDSDFVVVPARAFRRVVPGAKYLPTESTLKNITVPAFMVQAFDWIKNPDQILTKSQISLLNDSSDYNPYFSTTGGLVGLLPDNQWGPPNTTQLLVPQLVLETRLLSFWTSENPPCPQNYSIEQDKQINLYQLSEVAGCLAIANVTYQAGAILCQHCQIISPALVEAKISNVDAYPLIQDPLTSMALELTPLLGAHLSTSDYAIPHYTDTNESYVIELTSRAYQAAWVGISTRFGNDTETSAMIALPRSHATVIPWRVYLWVALHLCVIALGLLFAYIQSRCDHPWADDPIMAVFWLNTSEVSNTPFGSKQGIDPWEPGTELPKDGMLVLEDAGQRSRSVKIKMD